MKVVKVDDKAYIGKDIIYAAIFQKTDERMTYNMVIQTAQLASLMQKGLMLRVLPETKNMT